MGIPLRVKKLNSDAVLPQYAHAGDAGLDLKACEDYTLQPGERHVFTLGFATELQDGYVALIWDRSSTGVKHGIRTLAGVIDATYRGEWMITLLNTSDQPWEVNKGDKIAQALIQSVESVEVEEVEDLEVSQRGEKWCGSSGR